MSEKVVLHAKRAGSEVIITDREGQTRRAPLTDKIANKLKDVDSAYFYGRIAPDGVALDRYAPYSAWAANQD